MGTRFYPWDTFWGAAPPDKLRQIKATPDDAKGSNRAPDYNSRFIDPDGFRRDLRPVPSRRVEQALAELERLVAARRRPIGAGSIARKLREAPNS
jgi:hypothetical protein